MKSAEPSAGPLLAVMHPVGHRVSKKHSWWYFTGKVCRQIWLIRNIMDQLIMFDRGKTLNIKLSTSFLLNQWNQPAWPLWYSIIMKSLYVDGLMSHDASIQYPLWCVSLFLTMTYIAKCMFFCKQYGGLKKIDHLESQFIFWSFQFRLKLLWITLSAEWLSVFGSR